MVRLRAPAKLNLYLRVLGRRPDGYHELETLFERISLADELSFRLAPQGLSLTCDHPTLSCGEENLVLRAARLLQRVCGVRQGAAIHLTKRIPIAAGLGGGSSDAAATLLGLNRLWRTGCSIRQLCGLAAQVGSDVAFFIHQAPFAIGRGRGEQCEPLAGRLPRLWHVVVSHDAQLATSQVYAEWDASTSTLTESAPSITMSVHALRNGSHDELAKGLYNDLEPAAIRRCPIMRTIRGLLLEGGAAGALTSGSGPSVFGVCRSHPHAKRVAQFMRRRGAPTWTIRIAWTAP